MGSNPPPSTKDNPKVYKLGDLSKVQKEQRWLLNNKFSDFRGMECLLGIHPEFQKETILNLLILWEEFYENSSQSVSFTVFAAFLRQADSSGCSS